MRYRIRAALTAMLVLTMTLVSFASAFATEWRAWDDGIKKARASKRPVLVDVYTDWCGWCKRMDADVYARKDISEYLASHFVSVRLNAESFDTVHWTDRPMTAKALASSFKVTGYPTTIFLNAKAEHLANVPGYVAADRMLLLLHYIGDGFAERNVNWEDFVASQPGAK